jgi:hypothetical protein
MNTFFQSSAGCWRSVDEVIAVRPAATGVAGLAFATVTLRTGDIRVADYELDDLIRRPVQIMPAEPGTRVLHYLLDEKPEHWSVPAAGWALCADGIVRPMTTGGPVYQDSEHPHGVFVQMPDGSVGGIGPNADDFEDADQMLRLLVKRAELDKAPLASEEGSPA